MKKLIILITIAVLLSASPALAVFTAYFGEDVSVYAAGARPNSEAASASFQDRLVGVGTESFESFTADQTMNGEILSFGASGTATFAGDMFIRAYNSGTFATDGTKMVAGWGDSFEIAFSDAQAAFGFYGTDIGDFGGQLTLGLTSGAVQIFDIPHTIGSSGSTDGSVLFFGIVGEDTGDTFSSVSFTNSAGGIDFFGFDEMTIGTMEQVVAIPVPGAFLLGGIGVSFVGWLRRKKAL